MQISVNLSSNDPDKIDPVIEIGITPNRPDAVFMELLEIYMLRAWKINS